MNRRTTSFPTHPLLRALSISLAFAFLAGSILPIFGASNDGAAAAKSNLPQVCIIDKIKRVHSGKTDVVFRILRDDDTWSNDDFETDIPRTNHFVGQFFMTERANRDWTILCVFSASESKNYATILESKHRGNNKSLRQRLLDDFLTSVRLDWSPRPSANGA